MTDQATLAPEVEDEPVKQSTLTMKVVGVPMDSIRPHPKNARRGNVKAIKESLAANGQFRPILIQKSTRYIIGGNHTWIGAKDLGWAKIKGIFLDVSDEEALRIMLADNRTQDLATYDTEALAEILQALDQPEVGTGYGKDDITAILSAIAQDDVDVESLTEAVRPKVDLVKDIPQYEPEEGEFEDAAPPPTDDIGDDDMAPPPEEEEQFEDALAELQGSLILKEDLTFNGDNYYGVPELRRDMLLDALPEPFDTWAGKDATPDDGMTHWLFNYGAAAFSGLPADRSTMCFYTYDEKFEGWWDQPGWYTAKAINNGFRSAVVPDFSLYSDTAVALHVYNVWRAQWMGRYFQEAGLKVIPRLQFHNERSLDFCLLGIPKNPPILIHSAQNLESKGPGKPLTDVEKLAAKVINEALERLQPETFIVYGGPPSHRLVKSGHIKDDHVGRILCLQNYVWKRRGVVYDKQEGIGTPSKAANRKKRAKAADAPEPEGDVDERSAEERELDEWEA